MHHIGEHGDQVQSPTSTKTELNWRCRVSSRAVEVQLAESSGMLVRTNRRLVDPELL